MKQSKWFRTLLIQMRRSEMTSKVQPAAGKASFFICALLMVCAASGWAQATAGSVGGGSNDAQVQAEVVKALDSKRFKDVKADVKDGNVTLTGSVSVFSEKEDADRKVHRRKNVQAVQNLIQVEGPPVEDVSLRNKLAEKLAL